jgi:transposase
MEKTDFRKFPDIIRDEIRKKAIGMINKGMSQREAALILDVHYNSVCTWYKKYREGGVKAIKAKKRGVSSEQKKLLSIEQEKAVQKMITDKMPDQLKLPYALWTRKAVKELIGREFGVKLAIRTMGDYLCRWGFTPQKPAKRAYEQSPAKVKEWLDEKYPSIKEKARVEDAEIHWGDETGIRNDCQHGRSYAPKGKTPVKKSMSKRFSLNLVSTVTNQGKIRFMAYSGTMNSARFIDFLKRLIKGAKRKVFLILDNLRVHHSKPVKEWVAKHKNEIELFFLPSYSPERNPDEYLNCDLKQGISSKPSPREESQLIKNVRSHMKLLQNNPNRVKKYFEHRYIKYAA